MSSAEDLANLAVDLQERSPATDPANDDERSLAAILWEECSKLEAVENAAAKFTGFHGIELRGQQPSPGREDDKEL